MVECSLDVQDDLVPEGSGLRPGGVALRVMPIVRT